MPTVVDVICVVCGCNCLTINCLETVPLVVPSAAADDVADTVIVLSVVEPTADVEPVINPEVVFNVNPVGKEPAVKAYVIASPCASVATATSSEIPDL